MSSDFTGTNSEEIDKLVATVIELRTTPRTGFPILGISFPMMIGLLSHLVVQSFSTSAKVDRMADQIAVLRSDQDRLADRFDRIEKGNRP